MADMHKGYDKELKTIKPQSDIQKRLGNPSVLDRKVDLRVLSLGAGVQSSVMALMAAKGELPMPDCAIFSDTQWEPKAVYEHLDWLEEQLPFPVHRVTNGSLRNDAIANEPVRGRGTKKFSSIPWFTDAGAWVADNARLTTR